MEFGFFAFGSAPVAAYGTREMQNIVPIVIFTYPGLRNFSLVQLLGTSFGNVILPWDTEDQTGDEDEILFNKI